MNKVDERNRFLFVRREESRRMTREEAVEVIKDFVAYGKHVNAFVYKGSTAIPIEALNMAIEALEQQETLKNLKKPNKSDLISRQDAIEAVHGSYDEILDFKSTGRTIADSVEDIISNLPSAQVEKSRGR